MSSHCVQHEPVLSDIGLYNSGRGLQKALTLKDWKGVKISWQRGYLSDCSKKKKKNLFIYNRKTFNKCRRTLIDKAWGKMSLGIYCRRGLGESLWTAG